MIKLGALWDHESKKGNVFKSGKLNRDIKAGTKIVVFENTYKDKEKDPDYYIYLSEDRSEGGGSRNEDAGPGEDVPF